LSTEFGEEYCICVKRKIITEDEYEARNEGFEEKKNR
jgi:hypothetical protein